MSVRLLHPDEYELGTRSSLDSEGTFNLDEADFETQTRGRPRTFLRSSLPVWLTRVLPASWSSSGYRRLQPPKPLLSGASRRSCHRRFFLRRLCFLSHITLAIISVLVLLTAIFCPSYTRLPPHYASLRRSVADSDAVGRGNPRNEKVFIAASIYDNGGSLAGGRWGDGIVELIDLLGRDNVFLSIYENDSGQKGETALRELEKRVTCEKAIVIEEHLDLYSLPTVIIPGGEKRVKRIEYLAEVRNRALRPLVENPERRFDKLLYVNDVVFDPLDALQLLFSTNANEEGVAQYRAACAVDFINPFKFYDTYATRDLQGYSMGVPFFPWFTSAGKGDSRQDVLDGKDAVRVRSCWGGMVAFDARYFQQTNSPVRFRSGNDLFWEASECCLIHADIQDPQTNLEQISDTGIYMNPFVRVAYDSTTLSWLSTTRRFERLYSFLHNLINHLVGLPWYNERRAEVPGQSVQEKVWVANDQMVGGGSFEVLERIAGNDGYCGRRGLQVIVEHRVKGKKGYESIPIPTL
ncbi:hypothetical protein ASPZODRAFT_136484 [Penicilliopsis zonata CBS 506.65]|uniref:Glycosyltransferase family 69 protein n=1 Tax=Penicilliopsis zonata CBS 506.65 TaxID=1073090 RepID=A0A1L9S805_9EURO|nr:hypothetical protein ASPZODRAFT_136484 [Penicilliopsis zonata CBS 506.65]OJJ43270.1 hypothetical protein ASPZODRAFT_136484 [Penicilliopsis zonata CBS 506.65]